MTKEEIKSRDREKSVRNRSQRKDKLKPLTKIVIRHLPPTMTEEQFLKQIDPLPDHDFYYYALADWSLGFDATCRAYINFRNYDDVFLFRDRFDGYVFVDSKGAEYPAIVEFAPFQGLLKNKSRKTDPKVNTIEADSHYQNFLQKLEEEREAAAKGSECKLEFSLMPREEKKVTSTPLLQYLANKKEKRREETKRKTEEKRRQRDEEKERARQRQLQQNSKIIQSQVDSATGRKDSVKPQSSNKKGESLQPDDRKNSRSKRRAERDQRRREEHELRRREKEQNESASKDSDTKPRNSETEAKDRIIVSTTNNNKNNEGTDAKRKEVKKYSDRRERDRARQRNNQQIDNSHKIHTNPIAEEEKPIENVQMEISDSVKQFIQSVSAVKEFIPKHKINQQQQLNESTVDSEIKGEKSQKDVDVEVKSQQPNQLVRNDSDRCKRSNAATSAEERRIRNKDRPSIAIYQPKPRLAQSSSDATLSTTSKGHRSNPTSDYENEERCTSLGGCNPAVTSGNGQTRKISRYSEKRMGRAKDKMKERRSSGGDIDVQGNNGAHNRRRNTFDRHSKSGEDLVNDNSMKCNLDTFDRKEGRKIDEINK